MARIFKTPFGAQGDTEQVPEAPQGDGSVSLTQGFGYDYEREYEDPAAKDIRREVMNGLFHDITEAIGDIQLSGIAKWSADAAPYPAGAVVWHDSVVWMSTAGNNSSEPGAGSWKAVDLSSSIRLSEPIDQVPSANNVQEALAGLGGVSLGVGQTWQDVTSQRAIDTSYTNTTGRTICISVTSYTGNSLFISVDGTDVSRMRVSAGTSGNSVDMTSLVIVPPGGVYEVSQRGEGESDFQFWVELR